MLCAISAGELAPLVGICSPSTLTLLAGKLEETSIVQTEPGTTPLTRIPLSSNDWDKERVKVTIAPRLEE